MISIVALKSGAAHHVHEVLTAVMQSFGRSFTLCTAILDWASKISVADVMPFGHVWSDQLIGNYLDVIFIWGSITMCIYIC